MHKRKNTKVSQKQSFVEPNEIHDDGDYVKVGDGDSEHEDE